MTAETHDEETARMLAELEGEQTEREQLEAMATELGIKFRGNTGDDTLRERIAAAKAEEPEAKAEEPEAKAEEPEAKAEEPEAKAKEPEAKAEEPEAKAEAVGPTSISDELGVGSTITNPGKNVRRIGNLVIAPGSQKSLTERDVADGRTMAKVAYMIKLGVLHRGAE